MMTRQPLTKASLVDLDSDDRIRVLEIIDRFRKLGINENISLPQVRAMPFLWLDQGGQQSTNEQFAYLIDQLLMSERPRLVDCPKMSEID
jgi:hypothetical protein